MKLVMRAYLVYVLNVLVALVHIISANFDLYQVHGVYGGFLDTPIDGWQLVNDDPLCDQVDDRAIWTNKKDLSHGRLGIRCEGKCDKRDPPWPDVKLIEMHFTNNPLWHFTIYKDKGRLVDGAWRWNLYGIDDQKYGECFAYGNHEYNCDRRPKRRMILWGSRKFRCLTLADADAINEAFKKEPRGAAAESLGNSSAATWTA